LANKGDQGIFGKRPRKEHYVFGATANAKPWLSSVCNLLQTILGKETYTYEKRPMCDERGLQQRPVCKERGVHKRCIHFQNRPTKEHCVLGAMANARPRNSLNLLLTIPGKKTCVHTQSK